jgi:hypothetical protein
MRVHIFLFMRQYLKYGVFPGYYSFPQSFNEFISLHQFIDPVGDHG